MAEHVNPDDFIITRKRKLYKFALFANSPLCFEVDEWRNVPPVQALELGAGTGLFSVTLAENDPNCQVLAVDVKADRLQTGATIAAEKSLTNIRFLRARADQLPELLSVHSLQKIWITFPDPFPRERSAKNRLTHPRYLQLYTDLLTSNGALYLKHDNRDFFCWSLEQLVTEGWRIEELSFDLHHSDLSDDYKVQTTYEKRWLAEGLPTHFVKATPPRA
jgi:tRNA (guanine-N7-)-methyltransferase